MQADNISLVLQVFGKSDGYNALKLARLILALGFVRASYLFQNRWDLQECPYTWDNN